MPESPIGSIIAYGGEIKRGWEDQNGWLRCDGRLLDGTQPDYVALFEAIGAGTAILSSTCLIYRDSFYAAWTKIVLKTRIPVCLIQSIQIAVFGLRTTLGGMLEIWSVLLNMMRHWLRGNHYAS